MSASTAELTLIIKAQNLAETELAKVRGSLSKITVTAKTVAQDVANAFKGVGRSIGRQLGNLATDILSGGNIVNNMVFLGATMAGAVVEGLSAHFIPMILAKLAATQVWIEISAAFTAGGITAGTAFDAAVAVTMAALPFVLLAVAVAALAYLAANPEARQKAREVALMILDQIGKALEPLAKILHDRFVRGWERAMTGVHDVLATAFAGIVKFTRGVVDQIVDIVLFIPRAVARALSSLDVLKGVGQNMARAAGRGSFDITDLPGGVQNSIPPYAAGGWAGLHGPELALLGERGPEYVTPNHQLRGTAPGFEAVAISKRDLAKAMDREMYFMLRRAAPAGGRL